MEFSSKGPSVVNAAWSHWITFWHSSFYEFILSRGSLIFQRTYGRDKCLQALNDVLQLHSNCFAEISVSDHFQTIIHFLFVQFAAFIFGNKRACVLLHRFWFFCENIDGFRDSIKVKICVSSRLGRGFNGAACLRVFRRTFVFALLWFSFDWVRVFLFLSKHVVQKKKLLGYLCWA